MKLLSLLLLLLVGIAVFSHATAHGTNSSLVIGMKNKNFINLIGTSSNSTVKLNELDDYNLYTKNDNFQLKEWDSTIKTKNIYKKNETIYSLHLAPYDSKDRCERMARKLEALIYTKNVEEAKKLFDENFVIDVTGFDLKKEYKTADHLIQGWLKAPDFNVGIWSYETKGELIELVLCFTEADHHFNKIRFVFNATKMTFSSGIQGDNTEDICAYHNVTKECISATQLLDNYEAAINSRNRTELEKYIKPTGSFTQCENQWGPLVWNGTYFIDNIINMPRVLNIRLTLGFSVNLYKNYRCILVCVFGLISNVFCMDVCYEFATPP